MELYIKILINGVIGTLIEFYQEDYVDIVNFMLDKNLFPLPF
jgi:hypothetical protein